VILRDFDGEKNSKTNSPAKPSYIATPCRRKQEKPLSSQPGPSDVPATEIESLRSSQARFPLALPVPVQIAEAGGLDSFVSFVSLFYPIFRRFCSIGELPRIAGLIVTPIGTRLDHYQGRAERPQNA
jgi:hypothetical protein